jgi:cytochrome c oxidase subunit III
MSELRESPLPFGSARRPLAWAGTALGLVAFGMALSALLFAYAYLALQAGGWPPEPIDPPPLAWPLAATGLLVLSTAAAVALQRGARRGEPAPLQAAGLAIVAAGAAFLWLQWQAYAAHGLAAVDHVYASTFLVTAAMHHVVALGGMGAALVLVARLWGTADMRLAGLATALALYWYFVVASWLLIAAVLYGSPYLWELA